MDKNFKVVNQHIAKTDAFSIMGGAPVYTGDLVPGDALTVKILRSPYAFAKVLEVKKDIAMKVPGVVCILSHEDVPLHRMSAAGSSYPGNNPYDRRILDSIVRYVGDPVAIIAAEDEKAAEKAMKLVKVSYEVMEPVLDFEKAEEMAAGGAVVHPEDNYVFQMDIGGDLQKNILSQDAIGDGDFEAEYNKCEFKLDETYYTCANQQAMMETFRSFSYYDQSGRLTIVSSTQITFHVRRLIAQALGLSQAKVRVIKPRIGGGFGAKQSMVTEPYAAVVTWKTGRPAYVCFDRHESFACGNTRHGFRVRVRLGADRTGLVKALWVDSLQNVGAYGEHAVNVAGLSGHKTIPLYAKTSAWKFTEKSVYTNTTPGGAFRGFGATQGCFAVESTVNKLAMLAGLDPTEIRLKNLPEVGQPMPAYYGEILQSCALPDCIRTGRKMIDWDNKYKSAPFSTQVGPHRYRGLGMAVTMQGSGLTNLDCCTVTIRLDDGGFYTMGIGASDMGTGCDTILAQMAAEVLQCDVDRIVVNGVDTTSSPYDKGSYASSTTYVTGNATVRAAKQLLDKMMAEAAVQLGVEQSEVEFDGDRFYVKAGEEMLQSMKNAGLNTYEKTQAKEGAESEERSLSLEELGVESVNGQRDFLTATVSFSGQSSPPPFVAGFAEVEVDTETGEVQLIDLVGVVDCGTVINKNLAQVQAEGGFMQGAGMALYEQVVIADDGRLSTDSFMQYKIPSRLDVPKIRIAFEESYEPTGPFGAKSIGEVVINTPSPAIISAIKNAVGAEIHSLPATAEKVYNALKNK